MSSGWTNYTSGSDSEDERQASRILFDPRLVAQMSPQERARVDGWREEINRRERQRHHAQTLADAVRAMPGGNLAVASFKAFHGKAHRIVDGSRGITRALGAI